MSNNPNPGKRRGAVGPNIIRAWFDTVINPLLQALRVEQMYLEKGDCSWRFRPGGLERLRSVRSHLDFEAWDNLKQIFTLYPGVKRFADDHDKKVALLSEKCAILQQRLQDSPDLLKVYHRVTSPESLSEIGVSLQQVFGAYPPSDHLALLAQYIVNRTGDLPYDYYTARLWNKYKREFLAILDGPPVRIHSAVTERAKEALLRSVNLLVRTLEEKRLQLSLEHDVPYVTSSRLFVEEAL